jgi:hypothetical protein
MNAVNPSRTLSQFIILTEEIRNKLHDAIRNNGPILNPANAQALNPIKQDLDFVLPNRINGMQNSIDHHNTQNAI